MAHECTKSWMKKKIDWSNAQAAQNRNLYPIQEQATLVELWEYVPCTCDNTCSCKRFGCTRHWKLKKNLQFNDFVPGFLRTFVDKNQHRPILNSLNGTYSGSLNTRAIGAFSVLKSLKSNWTLLSKNATEHRKTLFCDGWASDFFRNCWSFPVQGTSIYKAKQYCLLLPDICVPYDTASLVKMNDYFDMYYTDYFGLLKTLRKGFLKCMEDDHFTMPTMRILESPQDQLPFNQHLISLPRQGMDYRTSYSPKERPLGLVIDKCFYQPTNNTISSPTQNTESPILRNDSSRLYQTSPLSGHGETIIVYPDPAGRYVIWGNTKFTISNEVIQTILEGFFIDTNNWYPLGASMTDPNPGGLGAFIRNNISSFTPRHASAIASIMVHEGLLVTRGKKPIILKKCSKKDPSNMS